MSLSEDINREDVSSYLKALSGKSVSPPPIWLMRQAGRYLPEYRDKRAEAGSFLDLCYTPDAAAEVTLQPIRRFDFDAAILFADILLIPQALGQKLTFTPGEGPQLSPTADSDLIARLSTDNLHESLSPIYETVSRVRAQLPARTPLIGFAGAPWTVAAYMIAGRGIRDQSETRSFYYNDRTLARELIAILEEATAAYLKAQIDRGADAIQLFDTWSGGLPDEAFDELCFQPTRRIAAALKDHAPAVKFIAFPRGAGVRASVYAKDPNIDGVGLDTGASPEWAAGAVQPYATVQGLLDPLLLVAGGAELEATIQRHLDILGGGPYIFNLGHGITPQTPIAHVERLIACVRKNVAVG